METLKYSEILKVLGFDTDCNDFDITGVSTDTRTISSGDLFIALNGANFRGSDFIEVAVSKGACAVISSDKVETSIPLILVDDTTAAYQKLASYYRDKFDIPVIAVTGSNGKTTTRNMIYTILSAKYKVLTPEKNFNNGIGLPRTLFRLDNSYDCAVLELGMNHLGEIDLLTRIAKPSVGVITNIGMAHIGNLGSQENIKKAKLEITAGLPENGTLIINGDDPMLTDVAIDGINIERIGNCSDSKLCAKDIISQGTSTTFTVSTGDKFAKCTLPIIGIHNVYNALEAIYSAMKLGFTLEDACTALSAYEAVSMRNEVSYDKGIAIIKDYYNASPDSMRVAINAMLGFKKDGKKIAILGQMHELGDFSVQEHKNLAQLCDQSGLDHVFFIGEDYEAFRSGLGSTKGDCFPADQRQELMDALLRFVTEGGMSIGDVVLIKGSRASAMEDFYESLKSYINSVRSDFTALPPSPTRLYVDINAMKHNYFQISRSLEDGVDIMPMVKANAYGCGVDIIANVFKDCKYLAVADAKEASLIRRILPDVNIMVIYQPIIADIKEILDGGYVCAVGDLNFAKALNEEAGKRGVKAKIHIEVDTGAARLGIAVKDSRYFAEEIKKLTNLQFDGIFMHYVCADSFTESDLEFTALQSQRFATAVGEIERVLGTAPHKHACAGAAIFNQNAVHYNMVRPGYMLYGYYPCEELREKIDLKPALRFATVILKITEHEAGTPVSYNRRYTTTRKTKIATVAVGYSDGIFRKLFHQNDEKSGCFVVNGQRAPIVGSICMDLTMIDITDIEGEVKVGDEISIFDNVNVTIDEMAELCDTIGYEIIARIEDKADRVETF